MPRSVLLVFVLLFLLYTKGLCQPCTNLGQTPQTAFPVCGLDTFIQSTVPQCVNNSVPANTCGRYDDTNPFWYRFTCYQSGTLGFTIVPNDVNNDDYDWEVFDITGRSPNDVYTDASLFVVGNWSGTYGITGTSATSTNVITCGSDPLDMITTFSKMPDLIAGHVYLLLVSHYTNTQSGYSLSFDGGTASITDPVSPAMVNARSNCAGESIYLKLSKKMKCRSLAANGSDFVISPPLANVQSVSGIGCSSGFDMDSVIIVLDNPLPAGNYSLVIQNGSDANTLLDNCDKNIPVGDSIPFIVYAIQPTPMDSLTPVVCAPDMLQLVFRNPMDCSSIARNGSDFVVNGTQAVSVVSASGANCTNGVATIINVQLNRPIQTAGIFTLSLQTGSDGNTLLDECAQETPPTSLPFITADTISADFSYRVGLGCVYDTLIYVHDGRNGVNQWNWIFDVNGTGTSRDSFFLFKDYGTKHIQLACSNGVCTDTASVDIVLDNELLSRFQVAPSLELCPEDAAGFNDSSIGKIVSWYWTFGDGSSSNMQNPPTKMYPPSDTRDGRIYPVALIVKNDIGCYDTSIINLKVLYNCYIDVPSGFTPNGDGLNDYLYPLNAYKADNLDFRIYNRYGQLIFETRDWTKKWDGRINGEPQGSGTYVWMLTYTHHDTGKQYSLKGTTVLIR